MPTLTRAFACLFFALCAYYLSTVYQMLYEDPRPVARSDIFSAIVAGVVGWKFVGSRIDKAVITNLFVTLQGLILSVLLALFLAGMSLMFTEGYKVRYKDLGEAIDGALNNSVVHLTRMTDTDFLILMFGMVFVVGLLLSILFRVFERRRRK